jgi:hypothetical protein
VRHEGPFTLDPAEIETGEWRSPAAVNEDMIAHPERYAESFRFIWSRAALELESVG